MSKTDKDEPYWVTRATSDLIKHDHRRGECVEETLEDIQAAKRHWPLVHWYPWGTPGPRRHETVTCVREHPHEGPRIWYGGPPAWYVHHIYHDRERARVTRELADARKWRREDLEDFDFDNRQARNSGFYYWW